MHGADGACGAWHQRKVRQSREIGAVQKAPGGLDRQDHVSIYEDGLAGVPTTRNRRQRGRRQKRGRAPRARPWSPAPVTTHPIRSAPPSCPTPPGGSCRRSPSTGSPRKRTCTRTRARRTRGSPPQLGQQRGGPVREGTGAHQRPGIALVDDEARLLRHLPPDEPGPPPTVRQRVRGTAQPPSLRHRDADASHGAGMVGRRLPILRVSRARHLTFRR